MTGMRRLGAAALSFGLLFVRLAEAGIAPPEPECGATYGIQLDEPAIAQGALDAVYIDGVVAIPVLVGLELASVRTASAMLESGLVTVDALSESGELLAGVLSYVPSTEPLPSFGQRGWLIWSGQEPFSVDATYQLEYSFVNDTISGCPEAISDSGTRTFKTGARSATEDLAPPELVTTELIPMSEGKPGCCSIPDSDSCRDVGRCFACWQSFQQVVGAQAQAKSALPASYFALDVSMAGATGELTYPDTNPLDASFTLDEPQAEYCFEATLRARAGGDEVESTTRCLTSLESAGPPLHSGYTAVPVAACADGPLLERRDEDIVIHAALGLTEEEARSIAGLPYAQPAVPKPTGQPTAVAPNTAASDDSSGCSLEPRGGRGRSGWLMGLGVLVLARARRPKAQSMTCWGRAGHS